MSNTFPPSVCRIGGGHSCCRYLAMGKGGFECLKLSELKAYLDQRVLTETMTARGDNCKGQNLSVEDHTHKETT